MKIKMITLYAGPAGVMEPGHEYDVAPELGKALVDGGFAESLEIPTPSKAKSIEPVVETAVPSTDEIETTVVPSPKRGSRKK